MSRMRRGPAVLGRMMFEAASSDRDPTGGLPSPLWRPLLPGGLAVGVAGWLVLSSTRGCTPDGDGGNGGDGGDEDVVRLRLTTSAYVGVVGPGPPPALVFCAGVPGGLGLGGGGGGAQVVLPGTGPVRRRRTRSWCLIGPRSAPCAFACERRA